RNWGTFVAQLQFDNPAPSIGSVAPSSTTAGGAPFTLTVNGSGFVSTSVVRWNGADRATTFVSTAQLTASIAAGDLLDGGTVTVTVLNSAPGGGTSAGPAFTINNPVPSLGALLPNLVPADSASVTVFNGAPAGGTSGAATFTITPAPTFSLTVSVKGSAPGVVTSAPAAVTCPATCAADFASGASVTLTAQAGSGAIFKAWSGACSDASVTCVVSMTAARSVTATFSKVFTDSTLTAGSSIVVAAHVLDLRSAIDALRTQYRLSSYAWSNALAGRSSLVRAIDLAEVRTALEATYV